MRPYAMLMNCMAKPVAQNFLKGPLQKLSFARPPDRRQLSQAVGTMRRETVVSNLVWQLTQSALAVAGLLAVLGLAGFLH